MRVRDVGNKEQINFNPFYDSYFLISKEGETGRRYLVELYEDELKQLKFEIDYILGHYGWNT
jgi:hypothetical protein